jgi:hypothetical protein
VNLVLVPPFNSCGKTDHRTLFRPTVRGRSRLEYSNELLLGKHIAVRLETEQIQMAATCFCVCTEKAELATV